jgi:thioredoxin 1
VGFLVRAVPDVRAGLPGSQHPDITFGKVETEDQPGWSAAARISSIPTLMAFRDGVLVLSQPGALPATTLEGDIQTVRDLDMDDVLGKLAQQKQPSAY